MAVRAEDKLWLPRAERLRARGLTFQQIAEGIGASPATVSFYMPRSLVSLSNHDLQALRRVACAPVDVQRVVREAQDARRLVWRERAEQKRRKAIEWRYRRRRVAPTRSFSYDLPAEDGHDLSERIADPSRVGQDPLSLLTSNDHIAEELLGDLGIADVVRMDEHQLRQLQLKLLDAGLVPSSVQGAERARLAVVEPHRGHAPAMARSGMSSGRGRTRKQQSESHRNRGKKFKRRQKQPRDGWGSLAA